MKKLYFRKLLLLFILVLIPTIIGIFSDTFVKTKIGYLTYFIFLGFFVVAAFLSMFEKSVEIVSIIAITIVIFEQIFNFLISLFEAKNAEGWTFYISILLISGIAFLLYRFSEVKE